MKRSILILTSATALIFWIARFSSPSPDSPGAETGVVAAPVPPAPGNSSAAEARIQIPPSSAPIAKPGAKPAARKFDPRFVQPATVAGLTGASEEEIQRVAAARLAKSTREKAEAEKWALASGWPIRGQKPDGGSFELMRLEGGAPVYVETHNAYARISHNVARLNQFDQLPTDTHNLSGDGWTVGMWENGPPRLSHRDFAYYDDLATSRATYVDAGETCSNVLLDIQSHATHVLGTMIGNGYGNNTARGMAWLARASCYGWCNDEADMVSAGATDGNQPGKLYVSNHSYGTVVGWASLSAGNFFYSVFGGKNWIGYDGDAESRWFGLYDSDARTWDETCRRTPYYLPFKSAGNDRGESPSPLQQVKWPSYTAAGGVNASPNDAVWGINASSAPGADGGADGYDTIPTSANAKNIMTVGNMQDAVSGGLRSTSGVDMTASSGCGPADDGRIKPDISGNGNGVYSSDKDGDDDYSTKTGTSMASPGAAGTAILLHEHYNNTTGQYMRASTLKALMLHTATDVLNLGPDYRSGWGLVDGLAAAQHIDRHVAEPGGYHMHENFLSPQQPAFSISFEADGPVKATLVWTDVEGTARGGLDDRSPALVNDLDISLRLPNGTLLKAPQLDVNNPGNIATYDGNSLDTVEMIGGGLQAPLVIVPQAGLYQLTVTHKGTLSTVYAGQKQAFSLMLQGNKLNTTGTVAEALEKEDRTFTPAAANTVGFCFDNETGFVDNDRAVNPDITDSQSAGFETKVTGPVTVSFKWGVSSEQNYDFLRFYVDGTKTAEISGTIATTTFTHNIPAGEHTLRWAYEKDSSQSNGSDTGWVDNLEFQSLPDAVDNFDLLFTNVAGSVSNWNILYLNQTAISGGDIAQSGAVTAAGQFSGMQTEIQGPALLQFTMVQSNAAGTLRFEYGSGFASAITHSAGNAYRRYSVLLGAGPQTVRWMWTKTVATASNGLVDAVVVTPVPVGSLDAAVDVTTPGLLSVESATAAAWTPRSGGAPSGRNGDADGTALSTVFTPPGTFPNTVNSTALLYSVTGPALVSGWWQATGSADGNFKLEIKRASEAAFRSASPATSGPRKLDPIPGGTAWQQVFLEVPQGSHVIRFAYTAAPSGAEGAGWVDQLRTQPFLLHPARGLDHWSQKWSFQGDAAWAALSDSSNGGVDSTSHSAVPDNGSTTLTATVAGPKRIYFHWKVSSETNFDWLRFSIDGTEATPPISGETAWQKVTAEIPGGNHVLRWTYAKDTSVSRGQDRGWLDQVSILRPDAGVVTRGFSVLGNAVAVPVRKDPTGGFFLEQSTDLHTWTPTGDGAMLPPRLSDATIVVAKPGPKAYYRLVFKPEIVHNIENAGFELPATPPGTFSGNGPGWGPDNDGAFTTSFEHITGFVAAGSQHLSIDAGAFSEMKTPFRGYRGVHSVTVAVGHRSGFTSAASVSSIALTSGIELARTAIGASAIPAGTWQTSTPISFDSFETNLDAVYDYSVRLESAGTRSFYDSVQVVSESQ